MFFEWKFDGSALQDLLRKKKENILSGEWVRGPAAEFHQYFLGVTDEHFEQLSQGGDWRGVHWNSVSESYIGKKRPSGKQFKKGDALLQDTGLLRRRAGRVFRANGPLEVRIETNLDYAVYHNEGDRKRKPPRPPQRPFQFFTPDDLNSLSGFTRDWLER